MTDFNTILFRASSNGDIMTAGSGEVTAKQLETISTFKAKEKLTDIQRDELARLIEKRDNPTLSLTCIKRLIKIYAKEVKGREEEIRSKYMEKGTIAEDDAITLYSRVRKKAFFKNTERLNNRYVTGLPDLGDAEKIQDAEEITDVKSSWSLITFLNAQFSETNEDYKWQGHTYLGLVPKCKRFRLAYCLVNSPPAIIQKEKMDLKWAMPDVIDHSVDPEYIERCKKIERNHIFDIQEFIKNHPWFELDNDPETWEWDIPMEERVFEIIIERNNDEIQSLYKKVERCRKWLNDNFNKKAA